MLQMTGSFKESLPSSIAAPTQKGELKREEEKVDIVMEHAGSEAAERACSNKPPPLFVVLQVQ